MASSKITLIGIENYLAPDHSVFEQLTLPEGIDKDTMIGTILLRCQEFELLYSDPEFLTMAISIWGKKNYWTFDKWVKILDKEYDPLYNKDYFETISDTHQGAASSSGNTSQSDDYTRTDNLATTNDVTETHSEKAYNSGSSFVETSKDVTDQDTSQTGTQRNAGTTSSSGSTSSNDSYVNSHTYHGYGNIGITSAQELFLKEVIDVATWNMYEHIADLFCSEFCIMVY